VDKSFIMSISKNNTDLSSYVIGWECGCGNKQEQRRCSGESGGIVRPGGTIPGARVRGGANMLPCVQLWSQSLRHMLLSLSLRCVGVAILTLCVVSRSWSSRRVVLWSWWLSCRVVPQPRSSSWWHCHRGRWLHRGRPWGRTAAHPSATMVVRAQ